MSDFADPTATGGTTPAAATDASGSAGAQHTADLEQRIRDLEQRLERLSGGRGGEETAYWAVLESVLPADARRHLRAAGREQLLAARSILDAWIGRMDPDPEDRTSRRETIPVE